MKALRRLIVIALAMLAGAGGGISIWSAFERMLSRPDYTVGGEGIIIVGWPLLVLAGVIWGREWAMARYHMLRPVRRKDEVIRGRQHRYSHTWR